jgi:hypothetical protein
LGELPYPVRIRDSLRDGVPQDASAQDDTGTIAENDLGSVQKTPKPLVLTR